jgi:cysteine synthase A
MDLSFGGITGNTPLIKVSDQIYAKLETYNPTGSVKDRVVSYIVSHAIQAGEINSSAVLCEATSGNTGIALSAIAANLGLPCIIFMPSDMSEERKQMMKIYGADIIEAPPSDFTRAIEMRDEFLLKNKTAWSPMQFSNPANIECHRTITAREIAAQVDKLGMVWSAFVHGSGTGGTIEGVRQFILNNTYDEARLSTKTCMVVPAEKPHGIQGIGDGKDFLANPSDMDDIITIPTEVAKSRAIRFAHETGLLVGISSGANIVASEEWLSKNEVDGIIVTMLCDRGERYMSIYTGRE